MSARHNRPETCSGCALLWGSGFACRNFHRGTERFEADYWQRTTSIPVPLWCLPESKITRRVWARR